MNECRAPQNADEFQQYYQLRWQVLRKPWQQPLGSEQDELEQQAFHRIIISPKQQILAVARLHLTSQHQAQIRYMAVAEQAQGQGYGKQIICALEQLAEELGVKEISLNAREHALGFYQSMNYQSHGFSHLLYQQIKHFNMSKQLPKDDNDYSNLANALQQTWHKTIAMSKAMNVEVCYFDGKKIQTSSDLIFNKNLHNTMFAGSIYTLATLTGWGWVYTQVSLENIQADIVLADANIRYHAPIKGVAIARTSVEQVVGSALKLRESAKTRFKINVEVLCGEQLVASFQGVYFAIAA